MKSTKSFVSHNTYPLETYVTQYITEVRKNSNGITIKAMLSISFACSSQDLETLINISLSTLLCCSFIFLPLGLIEPLCAYVLQIFVRSNSKQDTLSFICPLIVSMTKIFFSRSSFAVY